MSYYDGGLVPPGGGGGGGTWGSITGNISNQTDLQSALNNKENADATILKQTNVIDNLLSKSSIYPLSANQGRILRDTFLFRHKVKNKIDNLYAKDADVILNTIGSTDLQTAIDSLAEDEILEITTNGTYDPIVIPTTKKIIIRAKIGYNPKISGARCIRLSNGAEDVVISGLTIENSTNTGGNNNYTGTAITFNEYHAIVNDIIFHNISIVNNTTGSSVMLSYHWSVSGDSYSNPPQLDELSDNVAFVGCSIFDGCKDGTEGACISLRAMKNCYLYNNYINNNNSNGRGIQLQGVLSAIIEENKIYNIGGGNAEGIKVDQIGTSPFIQTAYILKNYTEVNIEGIDIDDNVSAIVKRNICTLSSNEGISLDNDSQGVFEDNIVFDCYDGIRFESGSTGYLLNNNSFNNTHENYRMDNGYSYNSSNISDPSKYIKNDYSSYFKSLTEATPINILDCYIKNNDGIGIFITYMIKSINTGTNTVETHCGELLIIARNQNGTIINNSSHINEIDLPSGSGITTSFSVTNGSGKITVSATATSGISPTELKIYYDVKYFGNASYIKL